MHPVSSRAFTAHVAAFNLPTLAFAGAAAAILHLPELERLFPHLGLCATALDPKTFSVSVALHLAGVS